MIEWCGNCKMLGYENDSISHMTWKNKKTKFLYISAMLRKMKILAATY